MSQEWNPNAPDVSQEFENARDNTPPEPEQQPEQVQGIATKAELEMLQEQRQTPVMESHLTIGGHVEQAVGEQRHDAEEARIQYLNRRLNQRSLKRDFDRSR
jgi:hypothetical protein